jgi:SAM-dependent methyltransferase
VSDPAAWGDSQAEVYDALYGVADADACALAVGAELAMGSKIIEAGCGTGRLVERFEVASFDVVGLDASEKMLERARAKCPLSRFHRVDLGADEWHSQAGRAECVIFAFNTLSMLGTEARQFHALKQSHAVLTMCDRAYSRLFVQQFVPDLELLKDRDEDVPGGRRVVRSNRAAQILYSSVTADDGRVFEQTHRYLFPEQLDELAYLAGFELRERWQDFSREPYTGPPAPECVSVYRPARS